MQAVERIVKPPGARRAPGLHRLPFPALVALLLLAGCERPNLRTASGAPNAPEIYRLYCEGCHGKDGQRGEPPAHLSNTVNRSLEETVRTIREGRKAMPAWEKKLKPDEIEAVARYARELGTEAANR